PPAERARAPHGRRPRRHPRPRRSPPLRRTAVRPPPHAALGRARVRRARGEDAGERRPRPPLLRVPRPLRLPAPPVARPAPLPLQLPPGPSWYLWGRRLVGVFGVLSVALVFFLGRKLAGTAAGLTAALFTAVSPVEVRTAHMIRPDVALEAFVLLAFLAFERISPRWRDDLVAGVALGAATAVKWTGVFLAPSYVLYRF